MNSQVCWINGIGFLIADKNVRIRFGTDWSKTREDGPFGGGRSWEASAMMICDYQAFGPPIMPAAATGDGRHANLYESSVGNNSGRPLTIFVHYERLSGA